jgi:hypothetical protein
LDWRGDEVAGGGWRGSRGRLIEGEDIFPCSLGVIQEVERVTERTNAMTGTMKEDQEEDRRPLL